MFVITLGLFVKIKKPQKVKSSALHCGIHCIVHCCILANVMVMVFCAHNTYSIYTTNKNKTRTPFQTLENQLHKTVLPCQAFGQTGHHKSHDWCHARRHRYSVRNSSSPAARCPRREKEEGGKRIKQEISHCLRISIK